MFNSAQDTATTSNAALGYRLEQHRSPNLFLGAWPRKILRLALIIASIEATKLPSPHEVFIDVSGGYVLLYVVMLPCNYMLLGAAVCCVAFFGA